MQGFTLLLLRRSNRLSVASHSLSPERNRIHQSTKKTSTMPRRKQESFGFKCLKILRVALNYTKGTSSEYQAGSSDLVEYGKS